MSAPTCQTCAHWAPKKAGHLARHGFGCCAHLPLYTTTAPGHSCKQHRAADAATTAARALWLNKLDAKASARPAGASKQEMKGKA